MIEKQYLNLVKDILENGTHRPDRTGTGRVSVFGRQIRHDMLDGFPLLTTKKMYIKGITVELLWFLRGDTDIKFLIENDCNIWNGDAYKEHVKIMTALGGEPHPKDKFITLAKEQGFSLGPIYGKQWREWEDCTGETHDQIQNLIKGLKTDPFSTRHMVNAWNVSDLELMVLPPCHYGFQCYVRELKQHERYSLWFNNNYETGMEYNINDQPDYDNEYYYPTPKYGLSLMWNQRSVDTFLGLPFNIASYAMLLKIIANEVNMAPDELIGNLGDCHLYSNHLEQAREQITRVPYELPKLLINKKQFDTLTVGDFKLENYIFHNKIEAPLNN
jgi:thymidylate synthase